MNINKDNFKDIFGEINADLISVKELNDVTKKIIAKLKERVSEIQDTGKKLIQDNNILKIGVVGQVKAGKSSFLNSSFNSMFNFFISLFFNSFLSILQTGHTIVLYMSETSNAVASNLFPVPVTVIILTFSFLHFSINSILFAIVSIASTTYVKEELIILGGITIMAIDNKKEQKFLFDEKN